ncbi:MAG: hypothetical protein G8345_13635 [Magnetococcales bacterium]|nr:hypothetical protein [Magnetococcales bacterium]NGZ27916.1 hypothetical protein [Magnetococcales bacterium]
MATVISNCFKVHNIEGNALQGKEKNKYVIKNLLNLPLDQQPTDFQQLRQLVQKQVQASP